MRFSGPGTKLKEKLNRGKHGINSFVKLARTHDIAYENSNSLADRHKADEILEDQTWEVFKLKNLKEKATAWFLTTAMKIKRKMGVGCGFKCTVKATKNAIKNKLGEKTCLN